jgi:hypothetical protein
MEFRDILLPYIVTHTMAFILVFICFKWPQIGKVTWGIIFLLAGIFNIYTASSNPQAYLSYGEHAIRPYQQIINGIFSIHTSLFVILIGCGQILVGLLMLMKRKLFYIGILGGTVFLLAIAPLGIGSAFPSTLLMALSLAVLYVRYPTIAK